MLLELFIEEMNNLVELWDKIASCEVPENLISDIIDEGISIGGDEETFSAGENDD